MPSWRRRLSFETLKLGLSCAPHEEASESIARVRARVATCVLSSKSRCDVMLVDLGELTGDRVPRDDARRSKVAASQSWRRSARSCTTWPATATTSWRQADQGGRDGELKRDTADAARGAIANHEKVVDSLLKANADLNAKNDDGESPLHYAAMNDSVTPGARRSSRKRAPSASRTSREAAHQLAYDATKKEKPGKRKDTCSRLRPAGERPGRRGQRRRSLPRPPRRPGRGRADLAAGAPAPPSARRRRRGRQLELIGSPGYLIDAYVAS